MDWVNTITAVFTAIGAMGTFIAIWIAIASQRKASRERRVGEVINRFFELSCAARPGARNLSDETLLIKSGAFLLDESEWSECLKILAGARLLSRADSELLNRAVLEDAVEKGVNLEDFPSRAGFRIGRAMREQQTAAQREPRDEN